MATNETKTGEVEETPTVSEAPVATPEVTPTPTAAPEPDITEAPAVTSAAEAIQTGAEATKETIEAAPLEAQERLTEEAVLTGEKIKQEEQFAQETDTLIKQQDVALASIEDESNRLAEQRAVRDAEALSRVKEREIAKANIATEEQRLANKSAVSQAEQKIEVAKQQSVWAFRKYWLAFSSGIINESQRIATNGAVELARVKVEGAKNLANTKLEVTKIEEKYASDVNGIIDKYTDIQLSNDRKSIERITNTNNNILLNNKQKKDAVLKITEDWKTDTRKIEDDLKADHERLSDKLIQQAVQLETTVRNGQNQERTTINRQFENGSWFGLTDGQKQEQLVKAGLGLEEGRAMENTLFGKTITVEVNEVLGNDITLTWTDRDGIQMLAQDYMEGGLVFSEATKRATLDYISGNARLRNIKNLQDAKAKRALTPKSSWTQSTSLLTPEERDAFLAAGWSENALADFAKFGWTAAATEWLATRLAQKWDSDEWLIESFAAAQRAIELQQEANK